MSIPQHQDPLKNYTGDPFEDEDAPDPDSHYLDLWDDPDEADED